MVNSPSIVASFKHNKVSSKVVVPWTSTSSLNTIPPVILTPPKKFTSPPNCESPATSRLPVVVKLLAVMVDGVCVLG